MKKKIFILFVPVLAVLFVFASTGKVQIINSAKGQVPGSGKQQLQPAHALKPDVDFGSLPLYFIANKGQVHKKARFYAKASRYTLWLTKEGLVFDSSTRRVHPISRSAAKTTEAGLYKTHSMKQITNSKAPGGGGQLTASRQPSHPSPLTPHSAAVGRDVSRLLFVGANKNPQIEAVEKGKLEVNYFRGSDKSKWRTAPTSMAVRFHSLYKHIDLKVYGIEKQIEYDWIVEPGGSPADIRFQYTDVKGTRIDKEGSLLIETAFGQLKHKKPFAYQITKAAGSSQEGQKAGSQKNKNTGIQEVDVRFKKVGENTYGFEVGEYDKNRELVIDPVVLAYSTYLGGNSSDAAQAIAVDASGYVYVTGYTGSSDFPTLNPYQGAQGGADVFVTKIDPGQSGSACLIYSTYLGGSSSDYVYGIAVDGSGYAYVTGRTYSSDFPTLNPYQGEGDQVGTDAFVTKIDTGQSGASSLLYSTYLGGSGHEIATGIAVDGGGYAYVTGGTYSSDFPTLNPYQGDQGDRDAFVTKIDPGQSGAASLLYSTYLGGNAGEIAYGIAVDGSGNAYVTGYTYSSDFPTLNPYQGFQGGQDVFVTKIDTGQSGASSLLYSTYLGGSISEDAIGIAVDGSGYAYVTGKTYSSDFPILNQYQGFQGVQDAFVTKIDPGQSGASSLLYSTYLGGDSDDIAYGIAVDGSGSTYATGFTDSSNFPTLNPYQGDQGDRDAFVTKIDTTRSGAASLLYSTYLGGSSIDYTYGIAVDGFGNAYAAGYTASVDFPTLDPYQGDQVGADAFITKLAPPVPLIVTSPNGGEVWETGKIRDITWIADASVTGLLKITLWQDDVFVGLIAKNIDPAAGSYSWKVGDYAGGGAAEGPGYTIKIREIGTEVTDASNAPFDLEKFFGLTSPDGGEEWNAGDTRDITWNVPPSVTGLLKITLWKDGLSVGLIAKNLDPAAGSYSWKVGDYAGGTAAEGPGYTIKIKEIGTAVADDSDAPFDITGITVTSPNGGETWWPYNNRDITWTSHGITGSVKIILYKDGRRLGKIAAGIDPAAGSYTWNVGQHSSGTAVAGQGYTVAIAEESGNKRYYSNGSFAIAAAINVESPNGGESWAALSARDITWTANDVVDPLKITLWKDDVLVGVIAKDVDPASRRYTWVVGQHKGGFAPVGSGYSIKIRPVGLVGSDKSDATFDITSN